MFPKYRFARASEFDKPWHLALWAPHDPDGPTVVINTDSPILEEAVNYHQDQYPDVLCRGGGKDCAPGVRRGGGMQSRSFQKLARKVPEEELDRDYRTEQALTIALMGLMAEEALIAQRLGKLGRKKPSTMVPAATAATTLN